jgi:hypothetical protein
VRQVHAKIVRHARRPGGEHDHPRPEKHRLGDAVGDEHDRLLGLFPDLQQLEVHLFAGHGVERPERLVHQDQLGIVDERARNGGTLLHAAGELVGEFVLGAAQSDQRQQLAGALPALGERKPEDFGRQQHVVENAPPFQQQRLLEHHADVARRIERLRRRADANLARLVGVQAGQDFQQRRLSAAGRADQRDQLAVFDVEGRLRDRQKLRTARAIDLAHAGEMNEWGGGGHCRRASRTTSRRSRPSTSR